MLNLSENNSKRKRIDSSQAVFKNDDEELRSSDEELLKRTIYDMLKGKVSNR